MSQGSDVGSVASANNGVGDQYYSRISSSVIDSGEAFVFAALIAAMSYVFAISGGEFWLLLFMQVIFFMWVVLVSFRAIRFNIYSVAVIVTMGTVMFTNVAININNFSNYGVEIIFVVAHVSAILAFFYSAYWATYKLDIEYVLEMIAWLLAPLLFYVTITGFFGAENERLVPFSVHPNWWGELAFGFIMCSLPIRRISVKISFIVIALILMTLVQSRGALLAALVTLLSYSMMCFLSVRRVRINFLMIYMLVPMLVVVVSVLVGWGAVIIDIFESKILLLNDPHRGLDTGLTGRVDVWMSAIGVFLDNPVFGEGINTHREVHNGFIRLAVEGGVLLLGVVLLMISYAFFWAWTKKNKMVVSCLLGIIVYWLTYPRALNLNLVGMLFIITLFPWHRSINYKDKSRFLCRLS